MRCLPVLAFSLCWALAHSQQAPLESFTLQPGTDAVTGALLGSVTVNSASECASACLSSSGCISFNWIPDESTHPGGLGPVCEMNQYSAHYALSPGRNASYYLKKIEKNDGKIEQRIPWQTSPPSGGHQLFKGQ